MRKPKQKKPDLVSSINEMELLLDRKAARRVNANDIAHRLDLEVMHLVRTWNWKGIQEGGM